MDLLVLLLVFFISYHFLRHLRRRIISPNFNGKVVWITGASSGLGQHLAYAFNRLGGTIIISARNTKELERVKSQCINPKNVTILPLDITNFESVKRCTQTLISELQAKNQGIDILVQNAGVSMRCEFNNYSFENHRSLFQVNVHGPIFHIQCCLQHLMRRPNSIIVGVSSVAGKLATAYRSSYAASKHALIGFLDSLRSQMRPHKVTVCNIMPGYVYTNLAVNAFAGAPNQRFGATDSNIKNGMLPQRFADEAVRGIYCKEEEFEVSKQWDSAFGIFFRNIIPSIVFRMLESNAAKQLKAMQQADNPKQETRKKRME